jgi:hypothetical protein
MKNLEEKVKTIAEKYADLVEKRLITALDESEIYGTAMSEINEGIRMLNHIATTLERISRMNRSNAISNQSDTNS